ncbi:MAG: hypothetical protein WDO24_00970 [Pseudomonadota bacterium]
MTWFIDTTSKRRLPAKLAAGFAVATLLVLGAGVGSARAEDHRGGYRHEERGGHGHWNSGYYRAPPVVYGGGYAPGYYPPPVVYGPGIGLSLPGINLNIR